MDNMEEGCAFKGITKVPSFAISWHQTSVPVIRYAHRWYEASRAAELKTAFSEDCHLPHHLFRCAIYVRSWEDSPIVQEYHMDIVHNSFMYSHCICFIQCH